MNCSAERRWRSVLPDLKRSFKRRVHRIIRARGFEYPLPERKKHRSSTTSLEAAGARNAGISRRAACDSTINAGESWHSEKNWYLYFAVALIAGSIFLGCIISPPSLVDDVDAVHAQMARTMLTSGDWVTAHLDDVPYLEKAPLLYWLIAGTYKIFGVHDWVARIPIALAAVGLCCLKASFG